MDNPVFQSPSTLQLVIHGLIAVIAFLSLILGVLIMMVLKDIRAGIAALGERQTNHEMRISTIEGRLNGD